MPIKRCLRWLAGWLYWGRRELRRLAGGARGRRHDGAAAVSDGRTADPTSLPAGSLDCRIGANAHGVYCVPRASQHRPVAQAILQARVWEAETLDLLCGADGAGDIVHAGTFFGDFIPALARSRTDGAKVWAFEPSRENYRSAQITILLNDVSNVVLTNAGLSAGRASALLATSDREGTPLGGASRLIRDPARARWWANEPVELLTVDEVLNAGRAVAAIHFDVEGHEQEALDGALGTIERSRPLIVLETLPPGSWVAARLEPLGYQLEGMVNRNSVLRCR